MQIQFKCVAVEQHGEETRLVKLEAVDRPGYLQFTVRKGEAEYEAYQSERTAFAGRDELPIYRDGTVIATEPALPAHEAHDGLYTFRQVEA